MHTLCPYADNAAPYCRFIFFFLLSDLFVVSVGKNAQPCDVACLFLLSEKRQGSMDFPLQE